MDTEVISEMVPLWRIRPSRWQPRDAKFDEEKLVELAHSIKEHGLINPVRVFGYDDTDGYVVWELIAGERRTRASIAIALAAIYPQHTLDDWASRMANVGLDGMSDEERNALHQANARIAATLDTGDMASRHLVAVIENLDRDDLSPLEEGRAYKGLMDEYGWSQHELARRTNKSQGYISQRLGLLSLNDVAVNALNTRVIGMAHARAIAAVPEALQAVATEYVVAEVKRDDAPATTRQIENQLRALSAFVDPARWEPNGERVYTPESRNRLAVIRMLVGGPHAEERIAKGWDHLRAHKDYSYSDTKNLLTARPLTIVEDSGLYGAVTNALGMRPQDAWQNHAQLENKHCSTCIFGQKWRPATPNVMPYCPRWHKATDDLTTCEGWIGRLEPVVIPIREYYVRNRFGDGEAVSPAYLFTEPFPYTNDLDAYLVAYQAATDHLIEQAAAREEKTLNGPRLAIQEFWQWQQTLPDADLHHSQAHACITCKYFEPLNGDAPCRFALDPLKSRWGDSTRAPEMGVLAGPRGKLLPRCEMFTRREFPMVFSQPAFCVGSGKQARGNFLRWMHESQRRASSFSYYARFYLWRGIFAWLYPNGNGEKYSWGDIESYFLKHWGEIGDGGMAMLFNALLLEVQAATTYRSAIELLDLTTGEAEPWRPISFEERNEAQKDWPEDWVRPWMQKTLVEVFAEEDANAG